MFYIKNKAWKKVMQYSEAAYNKHKSEISGMLLATQDNDGDWEVHSPVILKQTVSSGNTTLDKEELAKYYAKIGKKYNGKVKFVWWHSHHTMSAFWSGTDNKAIEEYADGDWSLALVVNLKEEYKFRVSYWNPIESHEDIDLLFIDNNNEPTKTIMEEVNALCTTSIYRNYPKRHNNIKKDKEMEAWNQSFNDYDDRYYPSIYDKQYDLWDDSDYLEAINFIDSLNGKYFTGLINYEEWKEQVVSYNTKKLKKENFYVEVISEKVLDQRCIADVPVSFLKFTHGALV